MDGRALRRFLPVVLAALAFALVVGCNLGSDNTRYKVSGSATISANLEWNDNGTMVPVPAGTYDFYAFALSSSLPQDTTASMAASSGYQKQSVYYDPNVGSVVPYSYYIFEKGDFYVVACLDLTGNAILDMAVSGTGQAPVEPFGMYPVNPNEKTAPEIVTINADLPNADMVVQSGYPPTAKN